MLLCSSLKAAHRSGYRYNQLALVEIKSEFTRVIAQIPFQDYGR